jgi:hypothetical protein
MKEVFTTMCGAPLTGRKNEREPRVVTEWRLVTCKDCIRRMPK